MDMADLSGICRRAEKICKKYDTSFSCEIFPAEGMARYATLHGTNLPSEEQIGLIVTGDIQRISQMDLHKLVSELEQLKEVWRVFLTFPAAHGLS